MNNNLEYIKCPKCGNDNFKGTRNCFNCGFELLKNYKSCPRCAKKNELTALKCDNCGFSFNKKQKGILFYILISAVFVLFLCLLVWLMKIKNSLWISWGLRGLLGIALIIILLVSFKRNSRNVIKMDAEDEINEQRFGKRNYFMFLIIVLLIAVVVILASYYFKWK